MTTGDSPAAVWSVFRAGVRPRLAAVEPLTVPWYPYRVELTTDRPETRDALLGDLFTTEPAGEPDGVLRLTAVVIGAEIDDLADRLRAAAAVTPEPVLGYDGLEYERIDSDGLIVWISRDENALGTGGNRHVVVRDGDCWWVVSGAGPDGPRHGTIIARELLRVRLLNRAGAVVHASAVVSHSSTVLFCGDGGAGKTTLAFAATLAGAALVSGDRTAVWTAGDELRTAGTGLAVRAREGTLRGLGLDERLRGVSLTRSHPSKVILTQTELDAVLGMRTAIGAPLAAVVFVERADRPMCLDRLCREEAAPLLARQIPTWDNTWRPGWLETRPGGSPAAGVIEAILDRADLVRLRWDPRRGEAPDVVTRVLSRTADESYLS